MKKTLLIGILMMVLLCSSAYSVDDDDLKPFLQYGWDFENTVNASFGTLNGTYTGGVPTYIKSNLTNSQAINLTGLANSEVNFANLAAWDMDGKDFTHVIMYNQWKALTVADNDYWWGTLDLVNDQCDFAFASTKPNEFGTYDAAFKPLGITVSKPQDWRMAVVSSTAGSGNMEFYSDSDFSSSNFTDDCTWVSTKDLILGDSEDYGGRNVPIIVDFVYIFNKTLNQSEMEYIFAGLFNVTPAEPKFNCTDNWHASYPCSNFYDNNYTSYATKNATHGTAMVWFNETKANNSDVATIDLGTSCNRSNITVPSACFDYDADLVLFRATSFSNLAFATIARFQCYNGSEYINMHTCENSSILYNYNISYTVYPELQVCGGDSNEQAINITFYNDVTNLKANATIAGTVHVWGESGQDTYTNFSFGRVNYTTAMCIYPETSSGTFDGQFEYSDPGYQPTTYYFTSQSISNTTQYFDFYMIPTGNVSLVTFTVTDQDDTPLENAKIMILKYSIPTNSSTTSQIIETGYNGQALGNIVLNTQPYRFIIIYNAQIYLETSDWILTTTAYTFSLDLLTDYFTQYNVANNVSCDLTFNNATRNFTFTYVDADNAADSKCLKVIQRTKIGDTTLSDACGTGTGGTLKYSVGSTPSNYQYIAQGYIVEEGYTFDCGYESWTDDVLFKVFGQEGLLMTFLVVLFLTMVGIFSPAIAIVFMIVGLIAAGWIGIINISGAIVGIVVCGIIVAYKVSNK